jgi:hypothetical protein
MQGCRRPAGTPELFGIDAGRGDHGDVSAKSNHLDRWVLDVAIDKLTRPPPAHPPKSAEKLVPARGI